MSEDVATVQFVDDSRADLQIPTEALYRSSLLQQAISDASEGDKFCFSLPQGVLDAWVEGLRAVNNDTGLPDQEHALKLPKLCARYAGPWEGLKVRCCCFDLLLTVRCAKDSHCPSRQSSLCQISTILSTQLSVVHA